MLDRVLYGEWTVETHTQPIVDLQRGVITGYEALARFSKEVGMSPDRVLRAAEEIGRRPELERGLALNALRLRDKLPDETFLTLNVSPTFMLSPEWGEVVYDSGTLERTVIEITEEHIIDDYAAVRRQIERIRALGGTIAIDDTGAGYASLKHVMELRPDFIKLDRLFVDGCHLDPTKRQMIELLGNTAERLDSCVVAEGIETEGELREMVRLGIPLGQGYFLGRPTPHMAALGTGQAELMRAFSASNALDVGVGPYAEYCSMAMSETDAYTQMLGSDEDRTIMVVDNWARPTMLVERHPLIGVRSLRSLMRVSSRSLPGVALSRALTRTEAERFNPIAIVNESGIFLGILRMERLIEAALKEASTPIMASYTPQVGNC
ncbi:EAL domain-containing protein [Granulicella cerasi]|uniref:EAL domain-containing protein n=1 Tax=Granulicella cerasi TaxID=741063 RepID=A0ABW1Z7T0_9BACT